MGERKRKERTGGVEKRRRSVRREERERTREKRRAKEESERVSQRGWTSVDQRRGVIEYEHAHGPITLLAGNPRCAVLRVIGYMMYDQRVDTARVQRQRGRRREQHTVCVTSAEGLDASSVCSLDPGHGGSRTNSMLLWPTC